MRAGEPGRARDEQPLTSAKQRIDCEFSLQYHRAREKGEASDPQLLGEARPCEAQKNAKDENGRRVRGERSETGSRGVHEASCHDSVRGATLCNRSDQLSDSRV